MEAWRIPPSPPGHTTTYKVVARVLQASPFSPNLAVDQNEVWFTLKDSGKTQVVSAKAAFSYARRARNRTD